LAFVLWKALSADAFGGFALAIDHNIPIKRPL
jgi:hypothetical protein